jgi:hypothetical protein
VSDPTTRDATGIPRGPCIAEAPRCVRCPCPADDGPYCSDACKDLDETSREVRVVRERMAERHRRAQPPREQDLIELGALLRHLDDVEHGDDALERSGVEWIERYLPRLLAGGTLEVRG